MKFGVMPWTIDNSDATADDHAGLDLGRFARMDFSTSGKIFAGCHLEECHRGRASSGKDGGVVALRARPDPVRRPHYHVEYGRPRWSRMEDGA